MGISARLERVRERLESAAVRAERSPDSVWLVAVTKNRTVAELEEAARAGVTDVGENRVQEAEDKRPAVTTGDLRWHLVGHLQSNKARKAVRLFDVIHSVDSLSLAQRIGRLATEEDKTQHVLVQVDLAGEEAKSGLPSEKLFGFLDDVAGLPGLSVDGLMVMPPLMDQPQKVRPYFRRLRDLGSEARERGYFADEPQLSMGMSHDFEVAVEEGATMVRIGTAIFGPRPGTDAEDGDRPAGTDQEERI